MSKLDIEEIQPMLSYFWEEKGDIERWASFEEAKPILQEKAPEVLKAWEDYKIAIKMVTLTISNLNLEDETN